jgi:CDP-glucose 4,6-dehydratase
MHPEFWRGRRVFVTGHTGFKGGWLALWLAQVGTEVHGYALEPPTDPKFFTAVDLRLELAASTVADIRDAEALNRAMREARPDVVLHLASQPLVRRSNAVPRETYAVNVLGTVNLLETVRNEPWSSSPRPIGAPFSRPGGARRRRQGPAT